MNGVESGGYSLVNFTSVDPQNSASFTLQINQNTVVSSIRDEFVKRLSTIMGISSNRTVEKISCAGEELVANEPNTTYITYYVLADPQETSIDISPIYLVRSLNNNRDQIEKFVTALNPGNLLLIEELRLKEPFWSIRASGISSGYNDIAFNIQANTCGYLYVSARKIDNTKWLDPTESLLYFYENMKLQN